MHEPGLLTLSESAWAKAKLRTDVIGPLAQLPAVSRLVAEEAAAHGPLSSARISNSNELFVAAELFF